MDKGIPRHRGGGVKYVFDPPTLTEDFRKIDRGFFLNKIARRRRKNCGVPLFKIWTVFSGLLTVFSSSKMKNSRVGIAIGKSIAATAIAILAKLIAANAIAILTKIDIRYRYRY